MDRIEKQWEYNADKKLISSRTINQSMLDN